MLMRRTIGISVAFLVISTGAMAAPHDKATSHHPNHKSQQAAQQTAKTHVVSIKPYDSRARSARHAQGHGIVRRLRALPPITTMQRLLRGYWEAGRSAKRLGTTMSAPPRRVESASTL